MDEHPDLEALSAFLDDEAPEVAGHVAGCTSCAATVGQLRSVAGAVGAPAGATGPVRETNIVAALAALAQASPGPASTPAPVGHLPARSAPAAGSRNIWAVLASVAALIVAVVATVSVLRPGGPDRRTFATAPFKADQADRGAADVAAATDARGAPARARQPEAQSPPVEDLGEISGPSDLAARFATRNRWQAPPATSLVTRTAPAPAATTAGPSAPWAEQGGPTCLIQAADQVGANPTSLSYQATGRASGQPVLVYGFSRGRGAPLPGGATLTLVVVHSWDCRPAYSVAVP